MSGKERDAILAAGNRMADALGLHHPLTHDWNVIVGRYLERCAPLKTRRGKPTTMRMAETWPPASMIERMRDDFEGRE